MPPLAIITGLPILLAGAALVGLPILLHLIMRQEPKRLSFPAFRFLKLQKRINQRKIRLRHLLLLLLRMALIALICLSLFQPTILSEGFSLRGDRPIAAVIVLDTSPSMGYVLVAERSGLTDARQRGLKLLDEKADGPWTALDEARGRIMEILEDLPSGSRVAILDTADRAEPIFEASVAEARQRVRDIKKPRANSQPVTRALESAYAMLARLDAELEPGQDPYPRLLAVFSDRTVPSWDQARVAELASLRDRIPPPSIHHVYVDVGTDKPVNTAITAVEFKPQIIAANQTLLINVTVESTGASENILKFSIDGEEIQSVPVNPAGRDRPVSRQLHKDKLKPGLHQAKIGLNTPDGLPFDNEKFITFRVREPRNVLALVDAPQSLFARWFGSREYTVANGETWKKALDALGWYACETRAVTDYDRIDWTKYEQVTLLSLSNPPRELWQKAKDYLQQGGRLIVAPAGPEMRTDAYETDAAREILPWQFKRWVELPPLEPTTWTWGALSTQRPFLSAFRQYVDQYPSFPDNPPRTTGFWKVEGEARERVIVSYDDAPAPEQRSPAVLERNSGKGRVMQFTTPLGGSVNKYHNYASTWFYMMLANEAVRALIGDSEDQVFNFTAGQNVLVKWPVDAKPGINFYLSGPDVTATDAIVRREEGQAFLRLGPEKTGTAGSFMIQSEDGKWSDGFSINAPVEESNLERLPPESIQELFGPDTIFPADKKLTLTDILSGKFTQPIELFPFLMILLLLVMAVENLLANKFYRKKRVGN